MKFSSKIGIIATIATLTGMAASAAFAQQPPREMKPLPRAEALKMAGERFDAADENHDGQLSAEEARAGRPEGARLRRRVRGRKASSARHPSGRARSGPYRGPMR